MRESPLPPEVDRVSGEVIGAAIEVHTLLGPGLREKMYESALVVELRARGLAVSRQVPFQVSFKGVDLGVQVIDLVVEGLVIVECKSVTALVERDSCQLVGYLRFARLPLGLLLNFNLPRVKDGIVRRVNWPLPTPCELVRVRARPDSVLRVPAP
ncbi:MAG TPA: GxxExxY protein [Phycisphaerales bacterium]|nr:GxxExxY protein [Phycisphaerales bacterium]